jgi:hypothetical protein
MTSIKEAFQQINTGGTDVLQGTVIKVSPLEIQITGDDKYIISNEVTKVPQHVKNLVKGDEVYILASGMGKQFFVLGRV